MLPTAVFKRGPIRVGQYDLLEGLGTDRLGTLCRAIERESEATVAVRLLKPELSENADQRERFFEEFRAAIELDHPNLVRAIDCGTDGSLVYLVNDFTEGNSLDQLLDKSGRLPESTAIRIITQVAQGLDYAHRCGVTHGGVGPAAVIVRPDGVGKLAGFGLPRELRAETGVPVPPPAADAQPTDAEYDPHTEAVRADVYCLAATLLAAVTRSAAAPPAPPPPPPPPVRVALTPPQRPSRSSSRRRRSSQAPPVTAPPKPEVKVPPPAPLSEALDRAIRRGMSPIPARRPASCLDFVKLLPVPSLTDQKGAVATPGPRPGRERRGAPRRFCAVATRCVVDTDLFESGSAEFWPATVRDVSATGIGVVLARRFEPGVVLGVEVGMVRPRLIVARVVRVHPDAAGHWFHGCKFDHRLTDMELGQLI